jgi:hypothetical protein
MRVPIAQDVIQWQHFILLLFHKDFGDGIQSTRGLMFKGISKLHSFWVYKTLWIGISHWTLEGFEFCFFVHIDGDMGIAWAREILEFDDICRNTLLKWE